MSMEPIQRQMTNPAAGVVNTPALLQDTVTNLTFIQLNVPNTILDMYNSVEPAAAADSGADSSRRRQRQQPGPPPPRNSRDAERKAEQPQQHGPGGAARSGATAGNSKQQPQRQWTPSMLR